FDLVVVPRHDRLRGDNVVTTRGALHRVTGERLRRAADEFAADVAALPRPLVAVLVGGDNGVYRLGPDQARDLGSKLGALARSGAGLAVTPSRRTGASNERILRDALAGLPAVVWDGGGANPYFGYLGLADAIVVTCDSVSMVSEAVSTGKPVYIFDLPGGSDKFRAFHAGFRADGFTRPLADALASGALDPWTYAPPDDTAMVAAEVLRRLSLNSASGDRNDAYP
ncbi:MAG: mitochondrial fission ELM1 family protein, partial [Proteobacteria bacterium]|nr:mitochondrial fission ELM1 family protein [Pseudomonadota bacterium]